MKHEHISSMKCRHKSFIPFSVSISSLPPWKFLFGEMFAWEAQRAWSGRELPCWEVPAPFRGQELSPALCRLGWGLGCLGSWGWRGQERWGGLGMGEHTWLKAALSACCEEAISRAGIWQSAQKQPGEMNLGPTYSDLWKEEKQV